MDFGTNIQDDREKAKQIKKAVEEIGEAIESLNSFINNNIADDPNERGKSLNTKWARDLKANWIQYTKNDVEKAKSDIITSATNLESVAAAGQNIDTIV